VTGLNPGGWAFTELLVEVFRVNGLLLAAGDELARPVGLTSARWQVLGVVDHGPSTVAQVARAMGLTRQSVRQTADALVRDGLVELTENPQHRRALRYVEQQQVVWANTIAERLPHAELRACLSVLRDLSDLLEAPDGE
jgi:DNA-binding MarR family transcriptional regulator